MVPVPVLVVAGVAKSANTERAGVTMRSFISALLLLLLILYSGYFYWLNAVSALYDPDTKMVVMYFWKNLTLMEMFGLKEWTDAGIALRLPELALFSALIACLIGFLWGWSAGRRRVTERTQALKEVRAQLEQERKRAQDLEKQLLNAYQVHETRLSELADKILSVTRAALPGAEIHMEAVPLPGGPPGASPPSAPESPPKS